MAVRRNNTNHDLGLPRILGKLSCSSIPTGLVCLFWDCFCVAADDDGGSSAAGCALEG